jgi:hypothetical protein
MLRLALDAALTRTAAAAPFENANVRIQELH